MAQKNGCQIVAITCRLPPWGSFTGCLPSGGAAGLSEQDIDAAGASRRNGERSWRLSEPAGKVMGIVREMVGLAAEVIADRVSFIEGGSTGSE